ncbi:MAG: 4-hydroxy-tetrahydrodipicolinate reductase [Bacteroidales bacterium]|nr:MAG: 4-hydroxy-tetrahydrodipicolinate reductase [Bacteroidales bacterium]
MRLGIIGYGKMGHEIENIALKRNHEITLIVDLDNYDDLNPDKLKTVDVAVEFTTPGTAYANIRKCFDGNVPVVSGTTGWLEHYERITEYCLQKNQAFFYASNYSLGVNILFSINRYLAGIMNNFRDYSVEIEETHHVQKLDAPSGTAITLADDIIPALEYKDRWIAEGNGGENVIPIHSSRKDMIPGIHTVKYDSEYDTLEITHSAKGRTGFAMGAVLAAEFLNGKKGIFGMKDLLPF